MINLLAENFSLRYVLLSLAVSYFIYFWVRDFKWKREIDRLGYRAPKLKTWPFGVDFIYKFMKAGSQYRELLFWDTIFRDTNTGEQGRGSFTIEFNVGGSNRMIWTANPENIKAVLTGQFADFGKGQKFHDEWEPFLGDSIFATDGEKWHFARQLLRPMFARERVVDVETFEHHLQKLIPMLGSGNGASVEVCELFFRYTLDAATDFLLGTPVGSMDDPENGFAKWFGHVQEVQVRMARAGPMKAAIYKGGYYRDLKKVDKFIDPIITQALELSPYELDHKLTKSDTFLHQMARATRDRKVIRDQIIAILLAGRDTTACTLSWIIHELSLHPEVQAKLKKEIISTLGDDGQPPTYNDIKDMKYLTAIINETLRRYPVVPFNVRAALKDTTLPTGGGPDGTLPIGVRKGTALGYSTLYMQRRKDLYPPVSETFPDPDEWAPDRWLNWTPKPWTFIPFNGGPRICIGQQFAIVEMGYTICRILQHFDHIINLGGEEQRQMKSDIVLCPANGVKVGFQKTGEKSELVV